MLKDDEKEEALEKMFTMRLTSAEREGLDWIAGERTREVRESSGLRTVKVTPSDALRELIRNDLERRNWQGPKGNAKGKR